MSFVTERKDIAEQNIHDLEKHAVFRRSLDGGMIMMNRSALSWSGKLLFITVAKSVTWGQAAGVFRCRDV
jgi:hypothetical protein